MSRAPNAEAKPRGTEERKRTWAPRTLLSPSSLLLLELLLLLLLLL